MNLNVVNDIEKMRDEFIRYVGSHLSIEATEIQKKLFSLDKDEKNQLFQFGEESISFSDERVAILIIEFLTESRFLFRAFLNALDNKNLKKRISEISLTLDEIYYNYRKQILS